MSRTILQIPTPLENTKKRNPLLMGCLIGCSVVFALPLCVLIAAFLYGVFLALFFPDSLSDREEGPDANPAAVSTPEWKTLNEKRYSFQYPADWTLRSTEEKPKTKTTRKHYGKGRALGYAFDYMFPPKEEETPEPTVNPLLKQYQYVLGNTSSESKVFSCIACRENNGLYDELTEENSVDKLLAESFPSFTCDTFEKGEVNGKRMLAALYSGESGGKKQTLHYYLSENNETFFTIWFLVEEAKYEQYKPVFDKIISTLRLK